MPTAVSELRSRFGVLQVHCLAEGPAERTPLICLHPVPFDGKYFADFALSFGAERTIWAPDYPGYGGSTAPLSQPSIDDYASVILEALSSSDLPINSAHLLGFHTGCLVACEMARQQPDHIADLVLIDVPCYTGAAQRRKYKESVTDEQRSWGFAAAFSYPCDERLALVTNRALLIATGSDLAAPTHKAANLLAHAELKSCPEITRPALANGRASLSSLIRGFLHR